jgi:lipid II:glycine glycyltransferase (peptidoglycan interpeptide bridge formation enzyme)
LPIEILKTTDKKYFPEFMNLYKDLSKRKHFIPHKEVEKEFDIFTKDEQSLLFLAKYDSKIISGAIIDFVGDMAIYRHGASSSEYRNIPAAYLLQWEAILEAKKRGKKIYNFWGIAPENAKNHPWQGHTLFKTGFGGEREFYIPTMDLPMNIRYWKNYAIDWISTKKKR